MTVERGSAYWIDLSVPDDDDDPDVQGSEQGFRRPGIVLQNNSENQSTNTTIVVPTTTGSSDDAKFLSTVFISSNSECLPDDSVALCTQLRVVDIDIRVGDKIGEISSVKLREIERCVEVVLDLM